MGTRAGRAFRPTETNQTGHTHHQTHKEQTGRGALFKSYHNQASPRQALKFRNSHRHRPTGTRRSAYEEGQQSLFIPRISGDREKSMKSSFRTVSDDTCTLTRFRRLRGRYTTKEARRWPTKAYKGYEGALQSDSDDRKPIRVKIKDGSEPDAENLVSRDIPRNESFLNNGRLKGRPAKPTSCSRSSNGVQSALYSPPDPIPKTPRDS